MVHENFEPEAPDYVFPAQVIDCVDGDTFDVRIDCGFDIRTVERVRTREIDTAEIHSVKENSEEYKRGKTHHEAFIDWVATTREELIGHRFPFYLYSDEFERGAYGRVIGDIWSPHYEEWASEYLKSNFEDV